MKNATKITREEFINRYKSVFDNLFLIDHKVDKEVEEGKYYRLTGEKFKRKNWKKFILCGSSLTFEENQFRAFLNTVVPFDKKVILTSIEPNKETIFRDSYEVLLPDRRQINSVKQNYFTGGEVVDAVSSCLFGLSKKWGILIDPEYKVAGFHPELADNFLKEIGGEDKLKSILKKDDNLHIRHFGMTDSDEHLLKSVGWDPEEFEDIESEDDDGRPDRGSRRLIWFKDIESGNDENEEEG